MAPQTMTDVSDEELELALDVAICKERECTADVVALFAEVDRRKLHLHLGYSSMLDYATDGKGYGRGAAWRRVRTARLAQQFPQVIDYLRQGKLSLATAVEVAPHAADHPELIEEAQGRSKSEVQTLIAATIGGCAPRGARSERNVGTEDVRMTVVISKDTHALLEEALALSFHKVPDQDVDCVLHQALAQYVESEKKRQFAQTESPRKTSGKAAGVSAEAKREVYQRDEGRCTYEGPDGVRCNTKVGIQIDHVVPKAHGGSHDPSNLRSLCARHNALEAEQKLGADFMAKRRQQAQTERMVKATLTNMGFKPRDASRAASAAISDVPSLDMDPLIRSALRHATKCEQMRT